jgi:hypothetical protein
MMRLPPVGFSRFGGWRGLAVFWLAVVLMLGGGALTLQMLGPPPPRLHTNAAPPPSHVANRPNADIPKPVVLATPKPALPPSDQPGRDTPGPVADPDPGLLEPARAEPVANGPTNRPTADAGAGQLPRISSDGRMPMQVYAAGFDRRSQRPRVGLLLAGIGLNDTASTLAIRTLPGGVTLAVSPYYSVAPDKILSQARIAEHEYVLSLPMEPQGFPNNDPGPRALMTDLPPAQNLQRLTAFLSRIAGYAGVTSALGALRGERFSAMNEQLEPILETVASRGLYWIDTRAGQAAMPDVWSRSIDVIIDEPPDQANIDQRLDQLAHLAQDRGAALGLATDPRPVTVERIAAWANGLNARGLALAPVSALVLAPVKKDATP